MDEDSRQQSSFVFPAVLKFIFRREQLSLAFHKSHIGAAFLVFFTVDSSFMPSSSKLAAENFMNPFLLFGSKIIYPLLTLHYCTQHCHLLSMTSLDRLK